MKIILGLIIALLLINLSVDADCGCRRKRRLRCTRKTKPPCHHPEEPHYSEKPNTSEKPLEKPNTSEKPLEKPNTSEKPNFLTRPNISEKPETKLFDSGIVDSYPDDDIINLISYKDKELIRPYFLNIKFDKIYEASKDGYTIKDLHRKTDSQSDVLWFFEAENGNIFGAFTERGFRSSNITYNDGDTFLFTLVNKYDKPMLASKTGSHTNADYSDKIGFGNFFLEDSDNLDYFVSDTNQFGGKFEFPDFCKIGDSKCKDVLASDRDTGNGKAKIVGVEAFKIKITG